jgi:hypothetical protein
MDKLDMNRFRLNLFWRYRINDNFLDNIFLDYNSL